MYMHGIAKKYKIPGAIQVNSKGCNIAAVRKLNEIMVLKFLRNLV